MSGVAPPFAPGSGANGQPSGSGGGSGSGNGRSLRQRHSEDFRRSSAGGSQGGQPVPGGRNSGGGPGVPRPFGPASPPNKNTKHVPCKFFRQGACQAGTACPFLHTLDVITPCKYYQKGNCKFGMKCANQHIMPDGRIANRPNFGMNAGQPPIPLGNRVALHSHGTPAASSSLLTLQAQRSQGPPGPIRPGPNGEYTYGPPPQYIGGPGSMGAGGDMGSMLDPSLHDLGTSPTSNIARSYTIRDAPLPESFDPQGVSLIPRTGPMAASVPAHFGIDPSSPPVLAAANTKAGTGLAFGSGSPATGLGRGVGIDAVVNSGNLSSANRGFPSFGSSPPTISDDLASGRRTMHSERYRSLKQPFLSSSLGAAGSRSPFGLGAMRSTSGYDSSRAFDEDAGEWDPAMQLEEDLLERDLRVSLDMDSKPSHKPLTSRRLSRTGEEDAFNMRPLNAALGSPRLDPSSGARSGFQPLGHRNSISGFTADNALASSFGAVGTPGSKVGSPPGGFVGSPSRFSQFFSKSVKDTTSNGFADAASSNNGALPIGNAQNNTASPSPFGHVGSPLRNANVGLGALEGDLNAGFPGSPPPHRKSSGSLSVLSQQLRQNKDQAVTATATDAAANLAPAPAPAMKRITSTSSNIPGQGIAEETEEEELFEMDVEEGVSSGAGKLDAEEKSRGGKRSSWQKAWGQGFDGVGRGLGASGR